MIKCGYSTDDIYHEYQKDTPISEIVKKTGIKRKTWNKRFERMEKKRMATINNKNNNYSKLIINEKEENNIDDNSAIINNKDGDIGDKIAENVATINTFDSKSASHDITPSKKDKVDPLILLFILLLIIGLILLFKWIYDNHNTSKLHENKEY